MFELTVTALAVLWAWEMLVDSPLPIPPILQPFLVAALSYGALQLPKEILFAGAVAGAVAVLHVLIRALAQTELPPVQARQLITRSSGRPGPGSRIPDLP